MLQEDERPEAPDELEPDPVIELYKRDIDRTLIREQFIISRRLRMPQVPRRR